VPPSFHEWETFYVITGSSGAGLTGLMFVVITLAAERMERATPTERTAVTGFSTPTVIHFAMVLLIAALMTMPRRGVLSLAVSLIGCAAAGLLFTLHLGIRRLRKITTYVPVAEDWIWHAILPCVAYAALLSSALVLGVVRDGALYVVASVVLLLLYIGVHNAWDSALYLTVHGTKPAEVQPTGADR